MKKNQDEQDRRRLEEDVGVEWGKKTQAKKTPFESARSA
jgi:hypothetical protein